MKKVAVFVEGQAEQLFVRELLVRMYQYTNIGIECYSLRSNILSPTSHHYPDDESSRRTQDNFYTVINAEGDNAVASAIRRRIEGLYKQNYKKVIGLRDMFCDEYHKQTQNRQIKQEINNFFITKQNETKALLPHSDIVSLFFAIMEVEAWFLGLPTFFTKINPVWTIEFIKEKSRIDISPDPEKTFYHPAEVINNIYKSLDNSRSYKKHETDVSGIVSKISKEDYETLINDTTRCSSFRNFVNALEICI
jgi:hypothetical protein